jgi:hypothetical protein
MEDKVAREALAVLEAGYKMRQLTIIGPCMLIPSGASVVKQESIAHVSAVL